MVIPQPIQVANLGVADSLILMVLALVVFGPRRLPEIGRKIGKLMYEFRKASNDFKFQMEEELRNTEEAEKRKALEAQQAEDHKRLMALVEKARQDDEAAAGGAAPAPTASQAASGSTELPGDVSTVPQSYPVIQPPSTGEPVQAARPGSVAAAASAIADMSDAAISAQTEAAAETNSAAPETTTHHG